MPDDKVDRHGVRDRLAARPLGLARHVRQTFEQPAPSRRSASGPAALAALRPLAPSLRHERAAAARRAGLPAASTRSAAARSPAPCRVGVVARSTPGCRPGPAGLRDSQAADAARPATALVPGSGAGCSTAPSGTRPRRRSTRSASCAALRLAARAGRRQLTARPDVGAARRHYDWLTRLAEPRCRARGRARRARRATVPRAAGARRRSRTLIKADRGARRSRPRACWPRSSATRMMVGWRRALPGLRLGRATRATSPRRSTWPPCASTGPCDAAPAVLAAAAARRTPRAGRRLPRAVLGRRRAGGWRRRAMARRRR